MIRASIPSPQQSLIEIGPLTIHFYALCIILGVVAAIYMGNRRFVAAGGAHGVVGDVAILAVPAGIIGGRIYRDWETDRKSTRLNSSHLKLSRMPSSA